MALTAERLREMLKYNRQTGVFTWKVRRGQALVGSVAGSVDVSTGYTAIQIDGKRYYAHRLAWLYTYGTWPSRLIDHKDRNPQNNRLSNLRDVTRAVNNRNNNARGWYKRPGLTKPYRVTMTVDGRQRHVGYYATAEEAHEVFLAARIQL